MMYNATLSSDERLKSRKRINYLFDNGQQLFSHPLKVYYLIEDHSEYSSDEGGLHLQFGVSVPKSLYKKAVDRNRLKRKIKESYRLAKPAFLAEHGETQKFVTWFFIYIDRNSKEDKIAPAIDRLFSDLQTELSKLVAK